jgi:hypothetical protein
MEGLAEGERDLTHTRTYTIPIYLYIYTCVGSPIINIDDEVYQYFKLRAT